MNDDPLLGRQLANFRIERPLGRGGMAQVYYGQDVKLQRPVAIKVIDARYRDNPAYAKRFVHEAQAIARWRHENIIHIYYADDQDGFYYFVMEYIDGLDLGQLLAQYSAPAQLMPQAEVVRIGRAVAGALDYAHRQGVIHRDVKPSNVMVAVDGRVVLTDFGLAMDVEQGSLGEVFGSANYVAPEQARHSAGAVSQSDLYSLGIILYEMLTGQVPFDDPSSTSVAVQHLTMPPPPPRELNPELNETTEAVLLKALSKTPEERYQTGYELLETLAAALPLNLAGSETLTQRMSSSPTHSQVEKPIQGQPAALPPAPSRGNRPVYLGVGAGLILALVTLCVILSLAVWWLRSPTQGSGAAESPALSPTDALTPEAANAALAPAETATPIPLLATEPPPPAPAGYDFLVVRQGGDSLFVVNLASDPLPLAPLSLGNDKGSIQGPMWGVPQLDNGSCVTVWKNQGKPKRPDISCNETGEALGFDSKDRFWEEAFEVYYGEKLLGVCQQDQATCPFNTEATFTPPVQNSDEDGGKKEENEGD